MPFRYRLGDLVLKAGNCLSPVSMWYQYLAQSHNTHLPLQVTHLKKTCQFGAVLVLWDRVLLCDGVILLPQNSPV